jgi:acyl carrier protein
MHDNKIVSAEVREFITQRFPHVKKHLKQDSDPLLDSGYIDSLGILEVVDFIESKYGILLSDEDMVLENFESIAAISIFIQKILSTTEQRYKGK